MSLPRKLWLAVMLAAIRWQPSSCCSSEEKNSHLWQIGTNPSSYLFGTMHVPYNKLWKNIPDNVKVAFASSQDVFLELDWTDEATNKAIGNCQLLPDNETVDMHLSARVFTRLNKYMKKLQTKIPQWYGEGTQGNLLAKHLLGDWKHKRPIWITLLLSSLNKENVRSTASGTPVLDVFLGNAAYNLGKKLKAMERVDDQCSPFNKLNEQQAEYVLKKELDFLDQQGFEGGADSTERNVNFYTCGDFEQMITSESLLPVPIHNTHNRRQQQLVESIEKVLTTHMILRRNRKMARKLLSALKLNPTKTHFFAIGAGHLVGNNSVIDYLRKRGVEVVHLSSNTTITGNQPPEDLELLGKEKIVLQNLSTLFTTQPTPSTEKSSTTEESNNDERPETARPTYSMTLGPFFTLPTTVPATSTTPTTPTTNSHGSPSSTTVPATSSTPTVTSSSPSSVPTELPSTNDKDKLQGSTPCINTTSNPQSLTSEDLPQQSGADTINYTALFRTLTISLITIIYSFNLC